MLATKSCSQRPSKLVPNTVCCTTWKTRVQDFQGWRTMTQHLLNPRFATPPLHFSHISPTTKQLTNNEVLDVVFCNSSERLTNVNPTERARVGFQSRASSGCSDFSTKNANQKQMTPTQLWRGRSTLSVCTKMKGDIGASLQGQNRDFAMMMHERGTQHLSAVFLPNPNAFRWLRALSSHSFSFGRKKS